MTNFFSSNFVILDRLFQGDNLLLFNSEQENVSESLFIIKIMIEWMALSRTIDFNLYIYVLINT